MTKKPSSKKNKKNPAPKGHLRKSNKSAKPTLNHIPIVNNLLIAIAFMALFYVAKDNAVGYVWVKDTLIGANLSTIKEHKDITLDQKLGSKLGFSAKYMRFLVENTPDTAVILLPPPNTIFAKGLETDLDKNAKNKVWATYFLYPRKLVFEDEKETSPLHAKATHVAVMNGWGYDKVNYPVKNGGPHTVLPMNK